MLKIQQIFPKLYRCLLYVVFHNLKPQNAGLVDVKKDLQKFTVTLIWSQNKNLHKMLKIQQFFPKLYRCLLYVVFHNLKPQNAGLVDVKKDLNSKRSKGIFVRENLKNKHSY